LESARQKYPVFALGLAENAKRQARRFAIPSIFPWFKKIVDTRVAPTQQGFRSDPSEHRVRFPLV
jgi:hypothetical protein